MTYRKKPKHARLVLPGESKDPPKQSSPVDENDLPDNAILLPRNKRTGATSARSRRRKRWLALFLLLCLILGGLALYLSGYYLYISMGLNEFYSSLRVAVTPRETFPVTFTLTGYKKAEPLGKGGFVLLGAKDMVICSSSGKELNRIQHGYVNPGITTGDTRTCVYSRGGNEYIIESRTDNIARRTTEQEILFTEMSPNGTLAVVTSSRYRANLDVYSPVYGAEPDFSWPLVDDKPVLVSFHPDNRNFVLGCLKAAGGVLNTNLYLLRTDRDSVQATIQVEDARLLQAEYISNRTLLAVFDKFMALYDTDGAELARFDYGNNSILTMDVAEDHIALLYGSMAHENVSLVYLDAKLNVLFETSVAAALEPAVLADDAGVLLLLEQETCAYGPDGALLRTRTFDTIPQDLVHGPAPLVVMQDSIDTLDGMLSPPASSVQN